LQSSVKSGKRECWDKTDELRLGFASEAEEVQLQLEHITSSYGEVEQGNNSVGHSTTDCSCWGNL